MTYIESCKSIADRLCSRPCDLSDDAIRQFLVLHPQAMLIVNGFIQGGLVTALETIISKQVMRDLEPPRVVDFEQAQSRAVIQPLARWPNRLPSTIQEYSHGFNSTQSPTNILGGGLGPVDSNDPRD